MLKGQGIHCCQHSAHCRGSTKSSPPGGRDLVATVPGSTLAPRGCRSSGPGRVPGQRLGAAEVGVQLTASELPAEAKPAAVTSERRLPGFRSLTRSLPGGRPAGGDQLPTCPRSVRPVNGPAGLPQSAPMDNFMDFGNIRPSLRGLHGEVPGGRGAPLIFLKDLDGQLGQGHLGEATLASDPEELGRVHRSLLVSREASARPCTVVTC